jgi:hypothetical protein
LDDGPHAAAWRRYRRVSWAFWILFVFFLPGMAAINRAFGSAGGGAPVLIAAPAWMIAFSVIGYQKSNFRCPRCGELFFRKFDDRAWRKVWVYNPFARRCMHCGLPKWT